VDDIETLIAAEHARRDAMVREDADGLAAMMADHFHYAHINGLVEDRATFLDRIRARSVQTPVVRASDLTVTLRPGYALLTGRSFIEFHWGTGQSGTVETLFLSVWERAADGWKISAYASTPLPDA
jgi:ketosteroid isomerase-like protein